MAHGGRAGVGWEERGAGGPAAAAAAVEGTGLGLTPRGDLGEEAALSSLPPARAPTPRWGAQRGGGEAAGSGDGAGGGGLRPSQDWAAPGLFVATGPFLGGPDGAEGPDATLGPVEAIEKYGRDPRDRVRHNYLQGVGAAGRKAGVAESARALVPLLQDAVGDEDPDIRIVVAEQAGALGRAMCELDRAAGYEELLALLPSFGKLLADEVEEVQEAAEASVEGVVDLLAPEDVEGQLMGIVDVLMGMDEEDVRLSAARLLPRIGGKLGEGDCNRLVVPLLLACCGDASFRIRKAAFHGLVGLLERIRLDTAEAAVFDALLRLAADGAWSVRVTCAESLHRFVARFKTPAHNRKLLDLFGILVLDESVMVRKAARRFCGQLIAALGAGAVNADLLMQYRSMAQNDDDSGQDAEACAYTFPAVVLTLGEPRWPDLQDIFYTLLNCPMWKVRRQLAGTLHEIAKVVGPDHCQIDLTPAAEFLLQDNPEVKIAIVGHLADLMAVFPAPCRPVFLEYFPLLVAQDKSSCSNWRLRYIVTTQLSELFTQFAPADVEEIFLPIVLHLCRDPVATVRSVAASKVGDLLVALGGELDIARMDESTREMIGRVVKRVKEFSLDTYQAKQNFVTMCSSLANKVSSSLFIFEFAPMLLSLSEDEVPNVRLVLASILAQFAEDKALYSTPGMQMVHGELMADRDYDVAHTAHFGDVWSRYELMREDRERAGLAVTF